MNVIAELKQKNLLLDLLMDGVLDVLQKDHPDLLNQIILRHIELCQEWDEKQEG